MGWQSPLGERADTCLRGLGCRQQRLLKHRPDLHGGPTIGSAYWSTAALPFVVCKCVSVYVCECVCVASAKAWAEGGTESN